MSATGASTNAGSSCDSATFSTIGAAVAAATAGATVIVCPGTYPEDVIVNKALTLVGHQATVDATKLENAIQVVSSDVSIRGFTLENANGEGLLIGVDAQADAGLLTSMVLKDVSVDHVSAINNDKGFNGTENGNCKYPGDCGGGIHLNGVAWSHVSDSTVTGNADGILLTDDYAPNSHNVIEGNRVTDNLTECGIVLPSHNGGAASFTATTPPVTTPPTPPTFTLTGRNPTVGGVFDNVIRDNVVLRNGTASNPNGGASGSGIGIFAPFPGTAAYGNVVEDNYIAGNGMAGFTIHAHYPGGEDISGNKVIDNTFGTNNTGGDPFDGPPGPTNLTNTTAIAVFSFAAPITMTITDNEIHNNAIGIWLSTLVTAHGLGGNHYHHVTTPVVTG